MSKPRHYWYGIARQMCTRYYKLQDWQSVQELVYLTAIKQAIDALDRYPNAEDRLKAVECVLFAQRGSIAWAAYRLHYSEDTLRRWINQFVNEVGRNAGFK